MTDIPDPKLVRDLARETIRRASEYDEYRKWSFRAILRDRGIDWKNREHDLLWAAAQTEMATANTVIAWPDEILPWPVVVAEPTAGVSEEGILRWRETWAVATGRMPEWPPQAEQVQDDPTVALDGLIDAAHRRRPGFDADVRAVALAISAIEAQWSGDTRGDEILTAYTELVERFGNRIEALGAEDAT